jgi:hypothetical protein
MRAVGSEPTQMWWDRSTGHPITFEGTMFLVRHRHPGIGCRVMVDSSGLSFHRGGRASAAALQVVFDGAERDGRLSLEIRELAWLGGARIRLVWFNPGH